MSTRSASTAIMAVVLLLGAGATARAQPGAVLAGSVASDDGEVLAGAHVYLAGTMTGTITRPDGRYRLEGLPLGTHRVVASMMGYEVRARDIVIREPGTTTVDFALTRAVHPLATIEVSAREQRRWLRRLERFERTLFGTSSFADSVRLLNPEVLDFRMRLGRLSATARAPLEIENRALGYRIRYDLTVFQALPHLVRYDGEPLFEELAPRDSAEEARWRENREIAYRGSLRHLLRSMIADSIDEEGFRLLHHRNAGSRSLGAYVTSSPWPIRVSRVLSRTDHDNEFRLAFPGVIEVVYQNLPEDERFPSWEWNVGGHSRPRAFQHSEIYLTAGPTVVDHRGVLEDAFGITRRGYFAFRRLAMLLPVEYGLVEAPGP